MDFCYRKSFADQIPEAYQRLLLDVFRGDHTLFVGAEETETSWKLFENVLDKGDLVPYPKGIVPESKLDAEWIDFGRYASICA
jgi:glucose-6-phosphate 1-dehydrogenase